MSDTPSPDQPTKIEAEGTATVFDNEIGDDWGEAFEADEFMQPPEEGDGDDFFLDDDAAPAAAEVETDLPVAETTSTHPSFLAHLKTPWLFLQKCFVSFRSLPLLYRIVFPLLGLLIVIGGWLFFGVAPADDPGQSLEAVEPGVPVQENPSQGAMVKNATSVKTEDGSLADSSELVSVEPEKVRKSWRLPSFLIPAKDNTKGDDIFFVEVDISLVFLLGEGEALPTTQGIMLRDIIYQFFTNRPIYELRRYSLARGEMNRKLRAWIEKQWSERHIATIVFNRYQVL